MDLENRILEISKKKHFGHIGSCLSVLPILVDIYEHKKKGDLVILDNAHAHLAHLVVREKYEGLKGIQWKLTHFGIHCDKQVGCDVSGGSLGHGIGLGIGLALVDRSRAIYVVVSDGSMMEGSNWEALRIRDSLKLKNLKIYCNFNGYSAMEPVDILTMECRMRIFNADPQVFWTDNGKGFAGVEGHYKVL